jgi:hypothetical protein
MRYSGLLKYSGAALALVTMVFLPHSLGQQKQPDGAQSTPESSKSTDKVLKGILSQDEEILRQNRELLVEAEQIFHVLSTNDTPIKVRGGSMTFFRKGTAWTQKAGPSICAEVDNLSQVRTEGFDDQKLPDGIIPGTTSAKNPVPLPLNWTLKIYGGEPSHKHGVELVSKHNNCSGSDSTKNSVTITPFGDAKVTSFYDSDMNKEPHSKKSYYIRFFDPNCATKTLDQDMCERVTSIQIFDNGVSPSAPSGFIDCPDLDCTVRIGTPKP